MGIAHSGGGELQRRVTTRLKASCGAVCARRAHRQNTYINTINIYYKISIPHLRQSSIIRGGQ